MAVLDGRITPNTALPANRQKNIISAVIHHPDHHHLTISISVFNVILKSWIDPEFFGREITITMLGQHIEIRSGLRIQNNCSRRNNDTE